jgi:hypothetical protein
MDFTTTISERDFVAGHRLAHKSVLMIVVSVWMYLLIAWIVYNFAHGLLMQPKGPYVISDDFMALGLILLWWVYVPYRVRSRYRKDPSQQGENVVRLGPEGVSEESSTGSTSYRAWAVCSHWRESKRVIVLMTQSGIFYMFPKACLSTEQQNELRGILTAALPKK